MNIDPNNLFPNPQFFENVFQELFTNNHTINLIEEEENFDIRFQPQTIILPPNPQLIQPNNVNIFQIRRRGRRERRIVHHSNINFDNLKRRIDFHFINFLIGFVNDALKEENLDIPSSFRLNKFLLPDKYNIFTRRFNLKEKTIKDILKLDISIKYRQFGPDANRKLLEKVESSSAWFADLFKMSYLELFKYYCNKEKPLNKITFANKEIFLSPRTESFYDLLEKRKELREYLIQVGKSIYLAKENSS